MFFNISNFKKYKFKIYNICFFIQQNTYLFFIKKICSNMKHIVMICLLVVVKTTFKFPNDGDIIRVYYINSVFYILIILKICESVYGKSNVTSLEASQCITFARVYLHNNSSHNLTRHYMDN